MLGQNIDRVFRIGAAYRRFVVANQEPLRRIAANTTQLRWIVAPYRSNHPRWDVRGLQSDRQSGARMIFAHA